MKTLITIVSATSIICGVLLWKAPDIIMYKIQNKPIKYIYAQSSPLIQE